jgi:predicted ATP-dependent Lon-type protease
MENKDFTIINDWYEINKYIFKLTDNFPKKVRNSITNRIENLSLEILDNLIISFYSKEKKENLKIINISFDRLRFLFRLCFDNQYISFEKYQKIIEYINEIGQKVGGWLKKIEKNL